MKIRNSLTCDREDKELTNLWPWRLGTY